MVLNDMHPNDEIANTPSQENHFYSIRPSPGSSQEPQIPPWLMSAYPRHPRVNIFSFGPLELPARAAAGIFARALRRAGVGCIEMVVRAAHAALLDDLNPVCGLPSGARTGRVLMDV